MSRIADERPFARAAGVLAVSAAMLAMLLDALVPADYALPMLYALPLVISTWAYSLRFVWALAGVLVAMTFLLLFARSAPITMPSWEVVLINRGMAALSVLILAGLVHARIRGVIELEERGKSIQEQNRALEAANLDLSDREEEIVRQNEELQAQTEELERQSEELRITNEELANREKTLDQLLELSRTLTADLPRDQMLKRICEALETLSGGLASAILERSGSELRIPCHHGFGPHGLEANTLPYAQSFAALIMSLGQSGYLEDIGLRPDLVIPQPIGKDRSVAVLSSPLRVRGQCVGTIEIYAKVAHKWNEAQIAMLESLAAQASISLQSAELVEGIRQERRRFMAAFQTVPFGMAVADDPEAQQVRLNPAAAAMFNVPVNENVALSTPIGARLKRYLFWSDRPVQEEEMPLMRALHGEEIHGEELNVVMPNDKHLVLLASAAPIYDARGKIAGAVSAFADITAHKTAQRELELRRREAEEASVRKTRFLASVSHDIRTPVNAINLLAELIRRIAGDQNMAAQIPEMAQKLRANAHALVELVSDVLDLARFDSGKVELQVSEFLLKDLLTDECQHAAPLAEDKGLELVKRAPDRPVWLRTDRVKLGRIIGNLVGNAIKFTHQGRVELEGGLDDQRRVRLQVRDTGIGIPASHLPRIFDEFAQVHNPERDYTKGTGLGLAICRRLVDVMGGTLTAESAPDKGSTFTVTLPSTIVALRLDVSLGSKAPEPVPVPTPCSGVRLTDIHILLVEDHQATRESIADILRREGAVVLEAGDAKTGLKLMEPGDVDVLLLDMMLPGIDGREVLRELQGVRPPGLKALLVLTGDLTADRLDEVKRLGADAVIAKPIDIDQLIGTLRSVQRSGSAGE